MAKSLNNERLTKLMEEEFEGSYDSDDILIGKVLAFAQKHGIRSPNISVVINKSSSWLRYRVCIEGQVRRLIWSQQVRGCITRSYQNGVEI